MKEKKNPSTASEAEQQHLKSKYMPWQFTPLPNPSPKLREGRV
jgi:hypothetical protein